MIFVLLVNGNTSKCMVEELILLNYIICGHFRFEIIVLDIFFVKRNFELENIAVSFVFPSTFDNGVAFSRIWNSANNSVSFSDLIL